MKGSHAPAARLRSLLCAVRGAASMLRDQPNARIHFLATVAVLAAGLWLEISRLEWCLVALACALVWAAEGMNTAVELLGDAITREKHPLVGRAKDVAAGAVLVAATGAAIVGALVFGPRLVQRFKSDHRAAAAAASGPSRHVPAAPGSASNSVAHATPDLVAAKAGQAGGK